MKSLLLDVRFFGCDCFSFAVDGELDRTAKRGREFVGGHFSILPLEVDGDVSAGFEAFD